MDQREICSVEDFHRAVREHGHGHFLVRGENSTTYSLRPKFGRFQSEDDRNSERIERAMLADFKRRSRPMLPHVPDNDWEWLAIAQHFGLATRLLDWTENSLIAAFFASRNLALTDRAIYFLDEMKFSDADLNVSPFDVNEVVVYRPQHLAGRISSQGGVFTVHNSPKDPLDDARVEKWIMKSECVIEMRSLLWTYKINDSFVFQDLDGLARYLNTKYVWGVIE
jgi:hypothetical protein